MTQLVVQHGRVEVMVLSFSVLQQHGTKVTPAINGHACGGAGQSTAAQTSGRTLEVTTPHFSIGHFSTGAPVICGLGAAATTLSYLRLVLCRAVGYNNHIYMPEEGGEDESELHFGYRCLCWKVLDFDGI